MSSLLHLRNERSTMKRYFIQFALAGILLVSISACTKEPGFPTAPISGTVLVTNNSLYPIQVFRYRPSKLPGSNTNAEWSANFFNDPSLWLPAGYYNSYYLPPGTFDLRFENETLGLYWSFEKIEVVEGFETPITLN